MKQKMEEIFKKYRYCKMFVDDKESNEYVEKIEKVVNELPITEQELIQERYMVKNADYLTDGNVREFKLDQHLSAPYYIKLRKRAFVKINQMLNSSNESVNLNDEDLNLHESIFKKYREFKFFNKKNKQNEIFIELIERVVNNLPDIEQELIQNRYMVKDADYMNDSDIYQFGIKKPMGAPYYIKIRNRAFENISVMLHLKDGALYD